MPINPALNKTQVDKKTMELLVALCKNTTPGVINRLTDQITNLNINFTNIKALGTKAEGVNLLVEALKANNEYLVKKLKSLATEEEIAEAEAIAARVVNSNATYVALSEQASPGEEPVIQEPKTTIHDIIQNKNINALTNHLEKYGSEINSIDPLTKSTPAETAVSLDWLEGLKLLVEKGADKGSLLHGALILASEEIIKYVVDELHLCTREECMIKVINEPALIKALGPVIATIGGVNIRLSVTGTALHHAAAEENTEAISNLITKHGADTEIQNDHKDTPLQHAVRAGKDKSFSTLVENKADVKVLTPQGENLLHIVTNAETAEQIMKLDEAEVLMKQADDSGNLPIHSAVSGGRNEVCAAMLNNCKPLLKAEVLSAIGAEQKSILNMIPESNTDLRDMLIEYGAKEDPATEVFPETSQVEPEEQPTLSTRSDSPVISTGEVFEVSLISNDEAVEEVSPEASQVEPEEQPALSTRSDSPVISVGEELEASLVSNDEAVEEVSPEASQVEPEEQPALSTRSDSPVISTGEVFEVFLVSNDEAVEEVSPEASQVEPEEQPVLSTLPGSSEISADEGLEVSLVSNKDPAEEISQIMTKVPDAPGTPPRSPKRGEVDALEAPATPVRSSAKEFEAPSTPKDQISKGPTVMGSPRTPKVQKTSVKQEDIKHPVITQKEQSQLGKLVEAVDKEAVEIKAAAGQDQETISQILAANPQVNLLNEKLIVGDDIQEEVNILQLAVRTGKFKALEELKKYWLHPELNNLVEAIKKDDYDAVYNIIDKNPILLATKLRVTTDNKAIPNEAMKVIDDKGVFVYIHFDAAKNNMNLLHLSSDLNKCEAALALLNNKINGNEQESDTGYTPLHYAIKNNAQNMVSILFPDTNLELRTSMKAENETPDEMAAFLGNWKILENMDQFIPINYIHLLKTLKGHRYETAKKILQKNPKFLSMCDKDSGITALMAIVQTGNTDLFRFCFEEKFLPYIKQLIGGIDNKHQNLLHYIATYGNAEIASTLKNTYPDYFNMLVKMKDKEGNLPVHIAAKNKDFTGFAKLYPLLDHTEQQVVVKKGFFSKKTTETVSESVLPPLDKVLNLQEFYKRYHEVVYKSLSIKTTYAAETSDTKIDLYLPPDLETHKSESEKLLGDSSD